MNSHTKRIQDMLKRSHQSEIKQAIIDAFVITGKTFLRQGNLKFILFYEKDKKFEDIIEDKKYSKDNKSLYKDWKKDFLDKKTGWKYPFKKFHIKNESFLDESLKDLQKAGFIKRISKGKYQLSSEFPICKLRDYDQRSISLPRPEEIILADGSIRLYGFDSTQSQFENRYKKEFGLIISKILEASAALFELQYRISLETYLTEIQNLCEKKMNISPVYSLLLKKYGKERLEADDSGGSIVKTHGFDLDKFSKNLTELGSFKDIYNGIINGKLKDSDYEDNAKSFLDNISYSNKTIIIHPLDFKQENNMMNSRKKWDKDNKKQWDVFDQERYIDILNKILSKNEFNEALKNQFDKNRDKWKRILQNQ